MLREQYIIPHESYIESMSIYIYISADQSFKVSEFSMDFYIFMKIILD